MKTFKSTVGIFSVLFIICLSILPANGQEKFEKYYEELQLKKIIVGDTITIFGHNYNEETSKNEFLLMKTDPYGDTLWTNSYPCQGSGLEAVDFLMTPDYGYLLMGTYYNYSLGPDIFLVRTDYHGDTLWTRIIDQYAEASPQSIVESYDGGYVITGRGDGDIFLLKIDQNGNVKWEKTYGGSNVNDCGFDIIKSADDGFLITGHYSDDTESGAFLLNTNANGDSIWLKKYYENSYGMSVINTKDGGYLMTGDKSHDLLAVKTDQAGDTLWTKIYSDIPGSRGNVVIQASEGNYLIGGYSNHNFDRPETYIMAVFKIDGSGNMLWVRNYAQSLSYGGWGQRSAVDISETVSGYYLLGKFYYYQGPMSSDPDIKLSGLFLVDQAGCTTPDPQIQGDPYFCAKDSTLLRTGVDNVQSIEWSTGEMNDSIFVTLPGSYFLVAIDSNNCPIWSDTLQVQEIELPDISIAADGPTTFCDGEELNLTPDIMNYDPTKTYSYSWNQDSVITSDISLTTPGTYTLEVKDEYGCSDQEFLEVNVHYPYEEQELGVVTVDVNSGDNLVIWENTPQAGITHYKIYRGSDGKELEIGEVPIGNATQFQDVGTFDDGQSYRYKITIIDTCGNESDYSTSHKTMHLTASTGTAGEVNLSWNHYEGFDVDWYYIFRGKSPTSFNVYDSVQYDPTTTEKTDYNPLPPPDTSFYRIGVKAPKTFYTDVKKVGSGPYSYSLSNVEDNRASMTDIKWIHSEGLKIYPNPMRHHATIRFANPGSQAHTLYLRDMSGRTVWVVDEIRSKEYNLHRGDLAAGLYFVEIRGNKDYRGTIVME